MYTPILDVAQLYMLLIIIYIYISTFVTVDPLLFGGQTHLISPPDLCRPGGHLTGQRGAARPGTSMDRKKWGQKRWFYHVEVPQKHCWMVDFMEKHISQSWDEN